MSDGCAPRPAPPARPGRGLSAVGRPRRGRRPPGTLAGPYACVVTEERGGAVDALRTGSGADPRFMGPIFAGQDELGSERAHHAGHDAFALRTTASRRLHVVAQHFRGNETERIEDAPPVIAECADLRGADAIARPGPVIQPSRDVGVLVRARMLAGVREVEGSEGQTAATSGAWGQRRALSHDGQSLEGSTGRCRPHAVVAVERRDPRHAAVRTGGPPRTQLLLGGVRPKHRYRRERRATPIAMGADATS